jgi:UDP-galactopyranose mutase
MFHQKVVIVGAGFFGLTLAERISTVLNMDVAVIDKRDHIGGNAYSYKDQATGIEIHKYGSHIFHTSNEEIWNYVNRFAKFNSYQHHVWTNLNDRIYSLPINLLTLQQYFKKTFSPREAEDYFESFRQSGRADNLMQKAIGTVGQELYEAFFKGYTKKQWGMDPSLLPAETISRLPVRTNWNTRYFSDVYEGIPVNGYGMLFEKMVHNPLIHIHLNTNYKDISKEINPNQLLIYTGPVDEFYEYRHGRLNWRTLDLEISRLATPDFQGTSVMNYASGDIPFTRIHEFKHFLPEAIGTFQDTVIMKEYSRVAELGDDCYYPVNAQADKLALASYRELQSQESNVLFGGRLGSYQYLDMHMAIGSALSMFNNKVLPLLLEKQ